jgi:phenylacetate-CoA ligase
MRKRRLRFLEGYPSTLHAIARFMLARGIEFPLTAAVSSSETLHDVQREEIERAFQCPLFDFYASAERVIFAAECDHHEGKHLIEEYGYVEVVDPEGRPLPPGTDGFLVGTSLHNTAMPLLRYQMSDVTHLRAAPCGCGRAGRMMANVATKAEDLIITPRGRVVSPASLTHPFKTVRGVDRSQLVQERPDYLSVRIVANDAFTPAEQELLIGRLQDRLGDDMRIAIVRTSAIPREPSGKFRWIVSHLPAQQWLGVKEGRP